MYLADGDIVEYEKIYGGTIDDYVQKIKHKYRDVKK